MHHIQALFGLIHFVSHLILLHMDYKTRYELDATLHITSYTFDPEEGQYIIRQLGSVYEYNQAQLKSMGITLNDSHHD